MKNNFMKKLKKGICVGMAGAMIITGTSGHVGMHPVRKVEASTADITTAKTKEEALQLLCDKTVMTVQNVKRNYESILADLENLIASYEKTGDIEREIYKEYAEVFAYAEKMKDTTKSELWNYTAKVGTEKQVFACKELLTKEITQLKNYYSEASSKYTGIRSDVNIKLEELKNNGSNKWEAANIANQKCKNMLEGFFRNFTSNIESMIVNYQELEKVCEQYTDILDKLPRNTVTPIATVTPIVTLSPTAAVSYPKTSVTINIKSNGGTYIKSCILTRISNGKESVHGDTNTGLTIKNGFGLGCDSNSVITIKNITLSNGKTFPDIRFQVGTTTFTYNLDLTSYEDYVSPTVMPSYDILYDANGGYFISPPKTISVHENETFTLAPAPQREGYKFIGWSISKAGIGKYYDAGSTQTLEEITSTTSSGSVILYAKWEKSADPTAYPTTTPNSVTTAAPTSEPDVKLYTLTLSANGGEFSNGTTAIQYKAEEKTLIAQGLIPTREGYDFAGWKALSQNATVTKIKDGIYSVELKGNEVLQALWTEKTIEPTIIPTAEPTVTPTVEPTIIPTTEPVVTPTVAPTVTSTIEPTIIPTAEPVVIPTISPTMLPTAEPQVPTQPAVTSKPVVTAKPISLKKKTIKIGKGEKVTVPLNNGSGKKIIYTSKNKKIATVTKKGIVKGVKTGTTTIYIKANGKKYSLKVMVKKKPVKIKITSVKSVKMGIGDKLILQAVLNKGAASYSLKWKSSNKKVVTVNSQGVATIKGKGKATITVQTYNGVKAKLNLKIK